MRSKWFCKYKLAHRGLHNEKYPENSLGAFENACKNGFGIELDIRLLKDGTPVVFHDRNAFRMCSIDKNINEITIDELEQFHLSKTEYTIPTLKQVLELIDGKAPLMIELKPVKKDEKIEKIVYSLLKDYKGEFAIKSFNPLTMMWFKKHAPEVLRGMLSSYFDGIQLPFLYKLIIKKLYMFNLVKPDFISYSHNDLPNKYVKKRDVPVIAWTINSPEMEKEVLQKADNIVFENYIPSSPTND